jgi:hypothetical protein
LWLAVVTLRGGAMAGAPLLAVVEAMADAVSKSQRTKGRGGEQQVAALFTDNGHSVLQLQRNRNDMADLLIDGWLYVDAKRQERWQLREWIKQVRECAPSGTVPAVVFRASREPWSIWTPALDFAERMP